MDGNRKIKASTLIKLMDIKTLTAGSIPVILGSVYSLYTYNSINYFYLIALFIAMVLVQSAVNMINDYYDFTRGSDLNEKEDEKALVNGEVTTNQLKYIIITYLLLALMIGILIGSKTSYMILVIALVGCIIGWVYTAGPVPISYTPFGEIISGVTMGLGITCTVVFIQSKTIDANMVLMALPTTIFIGTIMLSNNLSDLVGDRLTGRKTLPVIIGIRNSEKLWITNIILLLIMTIILWGLKIYPFSVIITIFLIFPYKAIRIFLSIEKGRSTKGKVMGLISKVGIKYHIGVIVGLIIAIIF